MFSGKQKRSSLNCLFDIGIKSVTRRYLCKMRSELLEKKKWELESPAEVIPAASFYSIFQRIQLQLHFDSQHLAAVTSMTV